MDQSTKRLLTAHLLIGFLASLFVENYNLYKPGEKISAMDNNEETKETLSRQSWTEKMQGWYPRLKSTTPL
jgi:hypothetical protein